MKQRWPDPFARPRETLQERRVHLEEQLTLDVPAVPPLCRDLAKLRPTWIDIGGIRLYCELQGRGRPVVLLHGGPGASHHTFHPGLSRLGDRARAIYYDQRGCGQSDYSRGEGYTLRQSIADLEALRGALGIDRWVVLGHSYGGFLAQCYAAAHPDPVAALILVCSGVPAPVALRASRYPDFLSPQEQAAQDAIFGNSGLSPAQLVFNAQLNGRWKRQCYLKPTRRTMARFALYEWTHDAGYYEEICADMVKQDLRGAFDEGRIPTLILEGRWDLTWNTDKPERLRELHPRARLEWFEHSGHSPFQEEPDRFFEVLMSFLAGLPGLA